MRLNNNNPFIWTGEFATAPVTATATDKGVNIQLGQPSVTFDPFQGDTSNYGFNYSSLEIVGQDNPQRPAKYDASSHQVTYYLASGAMPGDTHVLQYRWTDQAGNQSNEASVTITVQDKAFGYRAYQPSYACVKDGNGNNTGMAGWAQLEKYYTDNNSAYVPQTLKANTNGDPDYKPPVSDQVSCPLPGSTTTFLVYAQDSGVTVNSIRFGSANAPLNTNFDSTDAQPLQLQVPYGTYDSVTVIINNELPGKGWQLQLSASGGGSDTKTASSTAGTKTITFPNVTFTSSQQFGGELVVS